MMGKPELVWSPVQLRLTNQHRIFPIGKLIRVPMKIDGVHNMGVFEFIEIIDDIQLYPTLIGLEWEFDN
jgi:hypothetical protein